MEGDQKRCTAFANTSDIAFAIPGQDLRCQVSGPVVRGIDVMPLSVTHHIELISELLCLLSLAIPTPSLTHLEEITEVCFHGERRRQQST